MAHLDDSSEAVDAPATISMADAASVFADEDDFDAAEEGGDPEEGEEFDDDFEGEEPDEESDEEIDEDDEPEEAIDAPVSLNKAEKEAFSQLPKEAQQFVTQLESRRASQVQEATTKASQAQRDAEARAAAADAEAKRNYATQLDQFIKAFEPQMPDPQLAYNDPQRYVAAKARYDADKAQHDQLVQQIKGIGDQANTEAEKAFYERRDRELMAIPEVANEETRQAYLDKVMSAATKLGYDIPELARSMDAEDVKRLHSVADAFEKAEKYDAAMSRKMKRVRAGKQRNLKPGTAQHKSSGDRRAEKAFASFRSNPSDMKAAAAIFEDI